MEFEVDKGEEHKGGTLYCECGAEYYEEFMRDIHAVNDQAKFNHPELKTI